MTLKEIRHALADRNISDVARHLRMSRQQLWAIATGLNSNPTAKTLERIAEYLEAEQDDD